MAFRNRLILASALILASVASAATTVNLVPDRACTTLDGNWATIVDPYDSGYYDYRHKPLDQQPASYAGYFNDRRNVPPGELVEYDFDRSPALLVPRDWNSQDPRLFYYEGSVWYRKHFDYSAAAHTRVFLHFSAANYQADVYLNGKKLGHHTGGFTPFDFEVTGLLLEKDNSVVVRCNNRRDAAGVPTDMTDWWNYGGLTREVCLVSVPESFIADMGIALDRSQPDTLTGFVQVNGGHAGQQVRVEIPDLGYSATASTDAVGRAAFSIKADSRLERWAPGHPKLYSVAASIDGDRVVDRVGFRTIEVRGDEILLNGTPLFLRGACLHEENPIRGGRAYGAEDSRMLLGWARELNCNFLRLAHYPHNEYVARVADEMGILLWEEIPVYWTIHWTDPDTLALAKAQLDEVVTRDRNRASVIIWSVANETPVSEERTRFLKALVDETRALDSTRLVSAAMEVRTPADNPNAKIVEDPFGEYTDLQSFNEYVGWYDGTFEKIPKVEWHLKYNKPVIITEFGADALQGFHGPETTRYTEEYQARVYRDTLAMLSKLPHFRGCTPWILCDFRSPRRNLSGVEDGWNLKGLIGKSGAKKSAFWVLKAFYDDKAASN